MNISELVVARSKGWIGSIDRGDLGFRSGVFTSFFQLTRESNQDGSYMLMHSKLISPQFVLWVPRVCTVISRQEPCVTNQYKLLISTNNSDFIVAAYIAMIPKNI